MRTWMGGDGDGGNGDDCNASDLFLRHAEKELNVLVLALGRVGLLESVSWGCTGIQITVQKSLVVVVNDVEIMSFSAQGAWRM